MYVIDHVIGFSEMTEKTVENQKSHINTGMYLRWDMIT